MTKEYALAGVKTQEINLIPDERGFFAEALRQDWGESWEMSVPMPDTALRRFSLYFPAR